MSDTTTSDPLGQTARPLFVDNRDGNTQAKAIRQHLRALRAEGHIPWELCVATAFFNAPGFKLLAAELEKVANVRLLLGTEPIPEAAKPERKPGDPREPEFTRRQVARQLDALEEGLDRQRDLLPFDLEMDQAVRRLLKFLRSGRIDVRRYEDQFLHAKAFIFRIKDGGLLVGSSNFTYGGLQKNLELNLGHYSDPIVGRVEQWFDELWGEAVPFDLAAVYERLIAEYPPYLVYLRVLLALYGKELEQEAEDEGDGEIPVTRFQRHGIWRALRILEEFGGVLIADGVGLGKTYTAGEIIRQYLDRRQRVLLICPAALRDSTWREFLNQFQLFVESVSYEQLANDTQLAQDEEERARAQTHLQRPLDEYALVVIDEVHNYRNPDAPKRAGVLRQLLMGKRRDFVALSATPVNNSLWDLYHLLRYFLKQDAALADRGVLSMKGRFEDAMREDPFDLSPDLLYPVIDATTVKRTRQFVKKHYSDDIITGPDGKRLRIRFPTPRASSINYDLEEALPGFFDELQEALMPEKGSPKIHMARYKPDNFPPGSPPVGEDTALVGLIRSALLKRFESSAYAFCNTVGRMVEEHRSFLDYLERGYVVRKELLRELSASDEDDTVEEILASHEKSEPATEYNVEALQAEVKSDLRELEKLHRRAVTITPENSPKLAALVEELARVVEEADREAIDDEDARQKRKVLVFSFYEDTVEWIEEYLDRAIERDPRLAPYRGRMASVSGEDVRRGIPRDHAIWGFAPVSSKAPPGHEDDRFDLLVSTDVLAEGMNLQQCRNVINFDLPWNPMRLVQRHGRIDRINSPHKEVYLRTFFPDQQLNNLLDLEGRVRRKLAQAAASVGVETSPIEEGAMGDQSFAETREEIDKLREGDASIYEAGGTKSAAQTGEEYRQELREALQQRKREIEELPWKAGSGLARGDRRGHLFCATVGERIYLRFVPLDEPDEDIVGEIGTCLRLIECVEDTPRVLPQDLAETAFEAWQRALGSVHDAWTIETDPANLQPRLRPLNTQVADHLRAYPPPGIEDRELEKVLESVESPWSRREENLLRLVYNDEDTRRDEKSLALVEEIRRIGLEPFEAPDPLPPIEPDDIHLICWMAIEAEEELNGTV